MGSSISVNPSMDPHFARCRRAQRVFPLGSPCCLVPKVILGVLLRPYHDPLVWWPPFIFLPVPVGECILGCPVRSPAGPWPRRPPWVHEPPKSHTALLVPAQRVAHSPLPVPPAVKLAQDLLYGAVHLASRTEVPSHRHGNPASLTPCIVPVSPPPTSLRSHCRNAAEWQLLLISPYPHCSIGNTGLG